ncbi:MAG: hypothetical protein Kow00105_18420 [Phycisphaeraceae bacterium]
MPIDAIQPLTQFGVAGLMGLLWVWERSMSRKRETQLNEAHAHLHRQYHELNVLIRLVKQNTRAIVRFERTQIQLKQLLEKMNHDMAHAHEG